MSGLERRHYRLLLALDREPTISAAARSLYVTQSAASQQLRDAERRLGVALTVRSGRSVTITPAAERLVDAARIAEETLDAAEADARWLASSTTDALRLALGAYDATHWLGPLQARLDQDRHAAPIELVRTATIYGLDALGAGHAHAAIAPVTRHVTSRQVHTLFDDRLVAVVGSGNALAGRKTLRPRDFARRRYVTFSTTPEQGFEYTNFLEPHRAIPADVLRIESVRAIVETVVATDRLSIISRWTVPPDPAIVMIPLDPAPPPVTWSLLVGSLDDPARAATVDHLIDELRTVAAAGDGSGSKW